MDWKCGFCRSEGKCVQGFWDKYEGRRPLNLKIFFFTTWEGIFFWAEGVCVCVCVCARACMRAVNIRGLCGKYQSSLNIQRTGYVALM
jgi:hypothetical protein